MKLGKRKPAERDRPVRTSAAGDKWRRRVLEAALDEFSEKGFEGAGIRSIALRAGIEPGHLTYYARTKDGLWESVVEEFAADLTRRLRGLERRNIAGLSSSQARSSLESVLRHFGKNPRLTRLMLHEFSVASPRSQWVVQRIARPVWKKMAPVLSSLQARRIIRGSSPRLTYFSLMGSMVVYCGSQPEIMSITGRRGRARSASDEMIKDLLDNLFL